MGPGGRLTLIESDMPGIANSITKDGVTIFKSLGSSSAYEHLIIESTLDTSARTASEAGDGTTTTAVLAHSIVDNLFEFCAKNPKSSPQKITRRITKIVKDLLVPFIQSQSVSITEVNQEILKMVATISANGDKEMAQAVIDAFEAVGFGESSHVTIRELSGPPGFNVERIDGFPIPIGLEESMGKIHTAFINDQANQRCYFENPAYILYDGQLNDLNAIVPLLNAIDEKFKANESDVKNVVIFAHHFSDNVLTTLAFNFANPGTLNILPMRTPMAQFLNSQTHFLQDLAAFTGAAVFGLQKQVQDATPADLGSNMESFEAYRFRSTVVGDPDPINVEVRAEELKTMLKSPEGQAEMVFLQERLGKITNGIAKLTIFGGSHGSLKEMHDRCEDAICAVRAAIVHGALPGGGRLAIDMALKLSEELPTGDPAREVLLPSLLSLPTRLLTNAGHTTEEIKEVLEKLISTPGVVYDIENQVYGSALELGLFDATKAVQEALVNAASIANVLGTLSCIVAHPRDDIFERHEAQLDNEFIRSSERANEYVNEANTRA